MKKTFVFTVGLSIFLLTSCNTADSNKASENKPSQEEKNTTGTPTNATTITTANPVITDTSIFDEAQFLGNWSYNKEVDLLEISKKGIVFNVLWKSEADGYQPHNIICKLTGETLIGDYYGDKKNVKLKIAGKKKISFTIDPFAEFEPIKNQYFLKIN
jgi:hypothetical protein